MFSWPWVKEQLKNTQKFQVQIKPMSSVMQVTDNTIMILVSYIANQISYEGPGKRLQHLLQHLSCFVERCWKIVEWCWT